MTQDHDAEIVWVYSVRPSARPVATQAYRVPGASARHVNLGARPDDACGPLFWVGKLGCTSADCPIFVGVVPKDSGKLRYPVFCPYCRDDVAFPMELWRTLKFECVRCGRSGTFGVADPRSDWPESIECDECGAPIPTPSPIANTIH